MLAFLGGVIFLTHSPLISDKELTENFYKHKSNFERIVKMANEDSNVISVHKDYVSLTGYNTWENDSQEGFSTKRLNEYNELFKQLGSPFIFCVSKNSDIIEISPASVASAKEDENGVSLVISKGYAYSLKEPSPLVKSLDEMGFKTKGTYYKKISENWYLYFESGASKPE